MGHPLFAEPYQNAFLLRGQSMPAGTFDYLCQLQFDSDGTSALLDRFWVERVTSIVGDNPRTRHCPHIELTEYVHNVGVPDRASGIPSHLRLILNKEIYTVYLRFRLNCWPINSVVGTRGGSHACKHCLHCHADIEDRKHMVFECSRYRSIRSKYTSLFAEQFTNTCDLSAWLRENNQAATAHFLAEIFHTRFT